MTNKFLRVLAVYRQGSRALALTAKKISRFRGGNAFRTPQNVKNCANKVASVVRFLEQELAKLDQQSQSSVATSALDQNDGRSQLEIAKYSRLDQKDHESIIITIATNALTSTESNSLLFSHVGLYHRNRLFYGSEPPPLKIQTGINQERPYKIRGTFSASKVSTTASHIVPFEVAHLLLTVFIDHILPRYPCFTESELKQHFDIVYPNDSGQEKDEPPESSRFIVVMVLAISALTSKSHDFRKVSSLSESLHREALLHSNFLRRSNITTLRGFLLLIQFSLLLPHTSNLWYMTGEAMRMAIALGLHRERNPPTSFDQTDLRRRIFWTVS